MPDRRPTHAQLLSARLGMGSTKNRRDRAARQANELQAEADRLRSTARWQGLRLDVLRDEPYCRHCRARGLLVPATTVDHVVPAVETIRRFGPEAIFDRENLQGLCTTCHAAKSAAERTGASRCPLCGSTVRDERRRPPAYALGAVVGEGAACKGPWHLGDQASAPAGA